MDESRNRTNSVIVEMPSVDEIADELGLDLVASNDSEFDAHAKRIRTVLRSRASVAPIAAQAIEDTLSALYAERERRIQALRDALREGEESGPGRIIDVEAFLAARHAEVMG